MDMFTSDRVTNTFLQLWAPQNPRKIHHPHDKRRLIRAKKKKVSLDLVI